MRVSFENSRTANSSRDLRPAEKRAAVLDSKGRGRGNDQTISLPRLICNRNTFVSLSLSLSQALTFYLDRRGNPCARGPRDVTVRGGIPGRLNQSTSSSVVRRPSSVARPQPMITHRSRPLLPFSSTSPLPSSTFLRRELPSPSLRVCPFLRRLFFSPTPFAPPSARDNARSVFQRSALRRARTMRSYVLGRNQLVQRAAERACDDTPQRSRL